MSQEELSTQTHLNTARSRSVHLNTEHAQTTITLPNGQVVNPWLVLLSIMLGFFMSLVDATITNIALTAIQTSLKTDLTTVSWVINAYLIAFAGLLITMGRFADQFGRKRIFMIGMVIFSLSSLLCALAPNIASLICFRVLQGVGAAALNSVSLAIITGVFPPQKRGAAVGIWGACTGLAAAIGPVLGGLLLSMPVIQIGTVLIDPWRWIFFINIPFCIAALLLTARTVPEMYDLNATQKIDIAGLLTLSVGMVCISLALIQGNDWHWDGSILGLFLAAIIAFALFIVAETRQKHPLLDLNLFRIRSFSTTNLIMFLFGVAAQGAFLLVILYFIDAQNYSQLGASYAFLPMPLAAFVVSAVVSPLSRKISPKYLAIAGMALLGLGFLSFTTVTATSGPLDTTWRAIILGIGIGLCYSSLPAMVLADVPPTKLGVASGAFNTFRQSGFVIGVALLIGIFSGQVTHKPVLDAFIVCWFVCAAIALLGIIPALFLRTPRPSTRSQG